MNKFSQGPSTVKYRISKGQPLSIAVHNAFAEADVDTFSQADQIYQWVDLDGVSAILNSTTNVTVDVDLWGYDVRFTPDIIIISGIQSLNEN